MYLKAPWYRMVAMIFPYLFVAGVNLRLITAELILLFFMRSGILLRLSDN